MVAVQKNRVPRTPLPAKEGSAQQYVSAEQAAKALGIKPTSLYSYVSRGLIRSVVQPGERRRLYYREDIERAGQRMGGRAGMPETMEAVLSWGRPVVQTSITQLTEQGPVYRGRRALELATSGRTFESVAELLWSGIDLSQLAAWDPRPLPDNFVQRMDGALAGASGLACLRIMSLATAEVAISGHRRPDFERGSTIPDARALLQIYAAALGYMGPQRKFLLPSTEEPSLATILLQAVGVKSSADAQRAIDAALILCADHELAPATLATRVAASCGADLRACLQAAIATHSGVFMGSGCDQTEHLLRRARSTEEVHQLMTTLARNGGHIAGFNLKAYPKGDPRARLLLQMARSMGPKAKQILEGIASVEERFDMQPSLEVGLVALAVAIDLPPHIASAVWTIGRAAGWVAHVIEQRQAGFLMRPRAHYVGPPPM